MKELEGYFKIFLGGTHFHLLMKELVSRQLTSLDRVFVVSKKSGVENGHEYLNLVTGHRAPLLKKLAFLKIIAKRLGALLDEPEVSGKPIALFYPSDDGLAYQFAIGFLKKRVKDLKLVMYEDGLGSLKDRSSFRNKKLSKTASKHFYKAIFLNHFFNTRGFRGTVADLYVGLTDLSFKEEREAFSKGFYRLDFKGLLDIMPVPKSAVTLNKETHIFLTEVLVEDGHIPVKVWLDYVAKSADAIAGLTDDVVIKPHPREAQSKLDKTVEIFKGRVKNVEVVTEKISVEEYLHRVTDRKNVVLHGCRTGALFYVKLLYPEVRIRTHKKGLAGVSSDLDAEIDFHGRLLDEASLV